MQLICIIKSNFPVFNYLYSNCMPEKKVLRSFDHRSNIQHKKLICIPLATIAYHTSNPQKTQVVFSLLLHSPRHRMAKMVFVWLKFESMLISLPVCLQNSSIYNIKKKKRPWIWTWRFFFFFFKSTLFISFCFHFPVEWWAYFRCQWQRHANLMGQALQCKSFVFHLFHPQFDEKLRNFNKKKKNGTTNEHGQALGLTKYLKLFEMTSTHLCRFSIRIFPTVITFEGFSSELDTCDSWNTLQTVLK